MGKLLIKGVDLKTCLGASYAPNDPRTAQTALGTKIKGLDAEVDAGTKKYATGFLHDAFGGKVRRNGAVITCAPQGTRPMNQIVSPNYFESDSFTRYINNVNGKLYVSTSANSASGTVYTTSTDINKRVVVNLAMWGAGGKGGGGAYWLFAGNWGGVGGGGGAKVFYTLVLENNSYCRITTTTPSTNGRITDSGTTCYSSPYTTLYASTGTQIAKTYGGYSGTASNPREHQDSYTAVTHEAMSGSYGNVNFILRKSANGTAKRPNGYAGNTSNFTNKTYPYRGNPEEYVGNLWERGDGGAAPDGKYAQGHGSGGGGSFNNGGKSGDMGSGSAGSVGYDGGGGGGAGSPAGGASGGNGGYGGFAIYC